MARRWLPYVDTSPPITPTGYARINGRFGPSPIQQWMADNARRVNLDVTWTFADLVAEREGA